MSLAVQVALDDIATAGVPARGADRRWAEQPPPPKPKPRAKRPLIQRIIAWLDQQDEPRSIAEIAAGMGEIRSAVDRTVRRAPTVDLVTHPDAEPLPGHLLRVGIRRDTSRRPTALWVSGPTPTTKEGR